jgi:hypothetical protein
MDSPNIDRLAARVLFLWNRVSGPIVLAMPFLLCAYQTGHSLFISNAHAHLLEKALLVLDRRRFELIGFVYPPLPFLLLLLCPSPAMASVLAALTGGVIGWILWTRCLNEVAFPRPVRIVILLAFLTTPPTLYMATQSVGEILSLLFFLLAWIQYLKFTRSGQTSSGFLAGLILAIAFFVNHLAGVYGILYALCVPLFSRDKSPRAMIAAAAVLCFPVLAAIGSWIYLNWIFSGDALRFLNDPASSLFVYGRGGGMQLPVGWAMSWRAALHESTLVPLYIAVIVLVGWKNPSRLLPLAAPLVVTTLLRTAGLFMPDYLAIATYTVVSIAGISRTLSTRCGPILAGAACLQIVLLFTTPLPGEPSSWMTSLVSGKPRLSDQRELEVASYLSQMPGRSVLVDDRVAYRVVARANTVRPFILPADSLYNLAELRPAGFVSYVLAPASPANFSSGRVATVYSTRAPAQFQKMISWPDWQLYGRISNDDLREVAERAD